jgi:hypothetical protein
VADGSGYAHTVAVGDGTGAGAPDPVRPVTYTMTVVPLAAVVPAAGACWSTMPGGRVDRPSGTTRTRRPCCVSTLSACCARRPTTLGTRTLAAAVGVGAALGAIADAVALGLALGALLTGTVTAVAVAVGGAGIAEVVGTGVGGQAGVAGPVGRATGAGDDWPDTGGAAGAAGPERVAATAPIEPPMTMIAAAAIAGISQDFLNRPACCTVISS